MKRRKNAIFFLKKKRSFCKLTLADWVLMALLAAANGVPTSILSWFNTLLHSLGGPLLTSTTVGLYMIYGLLAMYIIRKPGVALFTYALGACIEIVIGNAYGPLIALAAAMCYAVVAELFFFLFRYRQFHWVAILYVSIAMVPLWFIVVSFLLGYRYYNVTIFMLTLIIRCISGLLLCGVPTKIIGDRLMGTRALRPFVFARSDDSPNGEDA